MRRLHDNLLLKLLTPLRHLVTPLLMMMMLLMRRLHDNLLLKLLTPLSHLPLHHLCLPGHPKGSVLHALLPVLVDHPHALLQLQLLLLLLQLLLLLLICLGVRRSLKSRFHRGYLLRKSYDGADAVFRSGRVLGQLNSTSGLGLELVELLAASLKENAHHGVGEDELLGGHVLLLVHRKASG